MATKGTTIEIDQLKEEIYDLFRSSTADILTLWDIRNRLQARKLILAEVKEIRDACEALWKEGKINLGYKDSMMFTVEFAFSFNLNA